MQGLNKKLTGILSEAVILKLNYDGVKNMLAFKNYANLNAILYSKFFLNYVNIFLRLIYVQFIFTECLRKEGYDEKAYAAEARSAIKLIKGRHFKSQFLQRKNLKNNSSTNQT